MTIFKDFNTNDILSRYSILMWENCNLGNF